VRFLQGVGGDAACAIRFCCGYVIKPTWRRHFRLPPLGQAQGRPFAKNAKERGTQGPAPLGHPRFSSAPNSEALSEFL
jgi:hypothetical protein